MCADPPLPRRAEGKDWCYDYLSCSGRFHNNPTVMSSNGWPATRAEQGLFGPNPAKNPFAGANYALAGYCSSDAWVGDAAASVLTYSFAFRGQRILCVTPQPLQGSAVRKPTDAPVARYAATPRWRRW